MGQTESSCEDEEHCERCKNFTKEELIHFSEIFHLPVNESSSIQTLCEQLQAYANIYGEDMWDQFIDTKRQKTLVDSNESFNYFKSMPFDIFYSMLLQNNVRGRHLIYLCITDRYMRDKCNQRDFLIFRTLLRKEYGIEESKSPKSEYFMLAMPKVYVCGDNKKGQIALGKDISGSNKVTLVADMKGIIQVSCEYDSTMFIDYRGRVWACGDNYFGQLGLGRDLKYVSTPTLVPGLEDIVQVTCGSLCAAVINKNGQVFVSGANDYGQLGLSDNQKRFTFTMIPKIEDCIKAFCHYTYILLLHENGRVSFCGSNDGYRRQFGIETEYNGENTLIPNLEDIVQIAGGDVHTVFLDKYGHVFVCGGTNEGQLGIGLMKRYPSDNFKIVGPIRNEKLDGIIQVACGTNHTVFLNNRGQVFTCGENLNLQLGFGNRVTWNVPDPTLVPKLENIVSIACGGQSTIFLNKQGQAFACGNNGNGQLGLENEYYNIGTPTMIPHLQNVIQASSGRAHSVFLVENRYT